MRVNSTYMYSCSLILLCFQTCLLYFFVLAWITTSRGLKKRKWTLTPSSLWVKVTWRRWASALLVHEENCKLLFQVSVIISSAARITLVQVHSTSNYAWGSLPSILHVHVHVHVFPFWGLRALTVQEVNFPLCFHANSIPCALMLFCKCMCM